MDILLSTNNTTLTFHTIEAVNINKERYRIPLLEYNIFLNIWTLRWIDIWTWSTDWLGGERAGVGRGVHGPHPDRGQHRDQVCSLSCVVELQTKVREYFTITERAFSWLKAPTSAFTFKTLC